MEQGDCEPMNIFIIDTETGGLDVRKHTVLSVGALVGDLETGEIIETYESLVKLPKATDYVVSDAAFKIHGITVEKCMEEGEEPETIAEQLIDLYTRHGCQLYGGHNVDIDVNGISLQIFKMDPDDWSTNFTYRKVDSHSITRLFFGLDNIKSGATLTQLQKALKIKMSDYGGKKAHDALYDAVLTFRALYRFRTAFKDPKFSEMLNG